jgi:hypothetical protein
MDREISTWFNQEAWTRRCTSRRVGQSPLQPVDRCLAPMGAAVVDHPEHPHGRGTRLAFHHLLDQPAERRDAGGGLAAAEQPGTCHPSRGTAARHYQPATIDHIRIAPVSASRGEVQAWGTSAGWLRMPVVDELGGYRWLGPNRVDP